MDIQTYSRDAVIPQLALMNAWCTKQLKNFPYLYQPADVQLVNFSDVMYVNDPHALVVVAKNEGKIVGVAAGIPQDSCYLTTYYFSPEIIPQFKNNHYRPEKIWYMGYFLMDSQYTDDEKIIHAIYELFVNHAKKLGKTYLSYVNVLREENHPLRPTNYRYLEPWGQVITDFIDSNVHIVAEWPTLQLDHSVKNEQHKIAFYLKNI